MLVRKLQTYSDDIIERTILPYIPHRLTPNDVTWMRILTLPFIYFLLFTHRDALGFVVFLFAALTDALDGAMARKRHQITEVGKVLDPVADRALIILLALLFIPRFFSWHLFFAIVVLEALNAVMAYRAQQKLGRNPGANWAGKVKMLIQILAFSLFFIALIVNSHAVLLIGYWLLWLSLAVTLLQAFLYPARRL